MSKLFLLLEINLKTHDELTRRGVITPVALSSGLQAVDLIGGWIDSGEFCEREHIVDGAVDPHLVYEAALGQAQRITKRYHVKLEIVAVFKEIVAHYRSGVWRYVEILAVCFCQHITVEVAGAVIKIMNVENLETESSTEEQR